MIKFQNEDKTLIVPSGLGNIPSAVAGSDVTKQDVIEIVDSAITEYDAELQVDLKEIRDNVSGNTEDIAAHGAALADMRSDINDLSGATENIQSNVETISGQTSANTADIATLSGQVDTLSSATVTGLETAQNAANSANTLASSAYTLADSAYTRADAAYDLAESLTGGTGGPSVYVLNLMTQQERADLYAELAPYRWQDKYLAVSSGFPAQDYAFYFYAGEETSGSWQEGDRGFVPMELTAIHPDDYGGACFFTGTVKSRQANNEILWVRYIVTSTGEVDKSTGSNNYDNPVGYFYINDDGSVPQSDNRYEFQDKGIIMIKCGDWNRGWVESLSFTDDYAVLHIKGKIQINGTEYAGYWKWQQNESEQWSTVSFTATN